MNIFPNADKYLKLREKYTFFVYESYTYSLKNNILLVEFQFNLADKFTFKPSMSFPAKDFYHWENIPEKLIQNIFSNLSIV